MPLGCGREVIRPEDSDSIRTLALIEAFAEIFDVTPAKIALILSKAKQTMTGPPIGPPPGQAP